MRTWWLEYLDRHGEIFETTAWETTTSPPPEAQCVVHNNTKYCAIINEDEVTVWREIPLLGWQKITFGTWKGAKEVYALFANINNIYDQLETVLFGEPDIPLGWRGSPDVLLDQLLRAQRVLELIIHDVYIINHKFASGKLKERKARMIRRRANQLMDIIAEVTKQLHSGLEDEYIPLRAKTFVEQIIKMYEQFLDWLKRGGYL